MPSDEVNRTRRKDSYNISREASLSQESQNRSYSATVSGGTENQNKELPSPTSLVFELESLSCTGTRGNSFFNTPSSNSNEEEQVDFTEGDSVQEIAEAQNQPVLFGAGEEVADAEEGENEDTVGVEESKSEEEEGSDSGTESQD